MGAKQPPSENTPAPAGNDQQLEAVLGELERVNGLLEAAAETTAKVMQFNAIAFAAGVVAALQNQGLFISVPLFWSAWLLYAQALDRTTVKRRVYAEHLEATANALLQREVFSWHGRLTSRAMNRKPFIFGAQSAYWGALNVAAWVAGVYLLAQESAFYAILAALVGAGVWLTTLVNSVTTGAFRRRVTEQISKAPQPAAPWTPTGDHLPELHFGPDTG